MIVDDLLGVEDLDDNINIASSQHIPAFTGDMVDIDTPGNLYNISPQRYYLT